MPIRSVTHIPIVVRDQDEALAWYQEKFDFALCEDQADAVPGYRWLTVAPPADRSTRFILMLPQQEADHARIGGNSMFVLACDDVRQDCAAFAARGVRVVDGPTDAPWGAAATVLDLYGNPYYLVQPPRQK